MANSTAISFRVFPAGKYFYAEVNIWPDKQAMYAHRPMDGDYEAICTGQEVYIVPPEESGKKPRKSGLFAEINFYKGKLSAEIISHEFTHAAFAFADRCQLSLSSAIQSHNWKPTTKRGRAMDNDGAEERFCYAVGRMVAQFNKRCYDNGLYEGIIRIKAYGELLRF